jgi:hypothetical protein
MALSTRRHLTGTVLHTIAALAAALAFRVWIVSAYPYEAGDTPLYELLARSLEAHGAYGLELDGRLVPVNVRMPGYPAFLAASHAVFGPGFQPVRALQAVIDTLACLLAGALAALLALAVLGTALAQIILFRILGLYGARRLSLVTYLMPGFALVYGTVLLDESLTVAAIGGLVLILAGVALGSGAVGARLRGGSATS